MTAAPPREPRVHDWGSAPDLYGPRHDYREAILLRRLLPALPGPRVLNAGCGAGCLTLRLADAGLEVTSIDASPAFVERVAGLVAERHPGRDLPVRRGDVQALDVAEGAFDAAVCAEVLEHLDDDLAALRGLRRALRPGGVLAVTVPAGPLALLLGGPLGRAPPPLRRRGPAGRAWSRPASPGPRSPPGGSR